METELESNVVHALLQAAGHRRLLPYKSFHALFNQRTPLSTRYKILESAISSISSASDVDYGVLLACANGLSGAEFFQRYRKYRYNDFVQVLGDPNYCVQSRKQQQLLVARERERVFLHVLTRDQLQAQRESA